MALIRPFSVSYFPAKHHGSDAKPELVHRESASAPFQFQHQTRVVFGPDAVKAAAREAKRLGTRVLLVTGGASYDALELGAELEAELSTTALERIRVPHEPDVPLADLAGASARALRAEVVLVVGGGSAIDVAKAAAVLAVNDGSARRYLEGIPGQTPTAFARAPLPVVCVPTTAGTGSEVTKNSVLQVPDLRVKRSMRAESMFPRSAYVDPSLSARAPARVRAGSGFDALTHNVEAFCSSAASPFSDALAREGIVRALRGLRALAAGSAGDAAAAHLAIASTLGGVTLANAGLGAAHGLVAPLGGFHPNVPHGAALACLLPATLSVNASAVAPGSAGERRLLEVAELVSGRGASVDAAARELSQLRRALGLPSLASYGSVEVDAIVAAPSGSLKTNPVTLSPDALRSILTQALGDA
jgi:alcohol dehydrogenase class IV